MNSFWREAQRALFQRPAAPPPSVKINTSTPAAPVMYQVVLQGKTITYQLKRSKRRSIGFSISLSGLQITAPMKASLSSIEQALLEKQRWVISKLDEVQNQPVAPAMVWCDGAQFPFLGQMITLQLDSAAPRQGLYDATQLQLRLRPPPDRTQIQTQVQTQIHQDNAQEKTREQVRRWLQSQAYRVFPERLALYAPQLGVKVQSFSVSSAHTRWGSCSSQGDIRLSWRLMHFDLGLVDYVVAHELAHLLEMNHSPRFWSVVERVYPDYNAARLQLRQQARALRHLF